jgi:hypothetical protein
LRGGGLLGRPGAVGEGTLQLSLGPLGAGLEGGAGLLCRCDLGLERCPQVDLVLRGVLPGLGYLSVSGLAGPGRVLLGVPSPGLCAGHRVVPFLLRGGYPLLRVPRGVLADLPRLQVCGHAGTVQLRAGGLRGLPRLGRVLLGVPSPGLSAGHCVVPLLLRGGYPLRRVPLGRGGPCLRGRALLFGGGLRRQRLGQPRIGLQRGRASLRGLGLGPLAALRASAPERERRVSRLGGPAVCPPCPAST